MNISNSEDFKKLPSENIDLVAHFAGALPASMEGYNGTLYIDSIVKGTYNVLEFMRKMVFLKLFFRNHYLISVTCSGVKNRFRQM